LPSQRKRNQLDELSNEFNSLAIRYQELDLLEGTGLKYSEQEFKGFAHDSSKAIVKLKSFPHKELLILFYCRHHSLIDNDVDPGDLNQKLQPIIQKLLDDTYDPNFSMKTILSAESLGIDPDEYQKAVENLP
jgi:hypothetical protein